jgi:uncharacterized protein YjbI with pentapeptide repeats
VWIQFNLCDKFLLKIKFKECYLNVVSFYQLNLKGVSFNNCKLIEIDFTKTNLTNTVFENSDLSGFVFTVTNLTLTDFSSAFNFSINPAINKMKGAKFSQQNLSGLLQDFKIEIIP